MLAPPAGGEHSQHFFDDSADASTKKIRRYM
jgi:hypothetical protein